MSRAEVEAGAEAVRVEDTAVRKPSPLWTFGLFRSELLTTFRRWRTIALWVIAAVVAARDDGAVIFMASAPQRPSTKPSGWSEIKWRFIQSPLAYIRSTTSIPSRSSPNFKVRAVKLHNASRLSRRSGDSAFKTGHPSKKALNALATSNR